ncbi:hypothetical protein NKH18_06940 [Streptomyces sp. M10(2022)]
MAQYASSVSGRALPVVPHISRATAFTARSISPLLGRPALFVSPTPCRAALMMCWRAAQRLLRGPVFSCT